MRQVICSDGCRAEQVGRSVRIILFAVGNRMPGWINQGFEEYAGRLRSTFRFELKEVAQASQYNAAEARERESKALFARIPANSHCVVMDVRGESWSTEETAVQLQRWKGAGRDVSLVIGGPEGLAESYLASAAQRWSLSPLTFPHPIVRVLVAEQLYRAESILRNHPYHRA